MNHIGSIIGEILPLLVLGGLVGCFIFWTVKKAEDPARMIVKWVVTVPVVALVVSEVRAMQNNPGAAMVGLA
ncbi:MAG TPA: hypothetical protein VN829_05100, partial [Dongiaceae bacterium]|nr:hypothetical protein [Dongiaceae bacterium]